MFTKSLIQMNISKAYLLIFAMATLAITMQACKSKKMAVQPSADVETVKKEPVEEKQPEKPPVEEKEEPAPVVEKPNYDTCAHDSFYYIFFYLSCLSYTT